MTVTKICLAMSAIIFFVGCSAKDLKEAGGNVAFNNGSGNAVGMVGGLIVGGAMYGVGAAIDSNKEQPLSDSKKVEYAKAKEIDLAKAKEWDLNNNTNVPVSNVNIASEYDKNGIKSVEVTHNQEQTEEKQ